VDTAIAEKVALDAGVGKEAAWKTQKGMTRIRESFETASGAIQIFSERVKEIAAIIPAQAGEHGRGFAVSGKARDCAEAYNRTPHKGVTA
jgi:methyl-accepting chemotaxis protein